MRRAAQHSETLEEALHVFIPDEWDVNVWQARHVCGGLGACPADGRTD